MLRVIENDMLLPVVIALAVVLLGYVVKRWNERESKDVVPFEVAFPEESSPAWSGRTLSNPSLESHLFDPSLLPPSSSPSSSARYITCYDPSTSFHLATLPSDSPFSISSKIALASSAQKSWKLTSFRERRKVLRSLLKWLTREQEGISRVCVRDSGKTLLDSAFGEILTTCSKLEWLIKHGETYLLPETNRPGNLILAHKRSQVIYEPLGVVAACVSWNYPFHNSLSPILASIFTGNAVILKCSEQVAWSSKFFIEALRDCIEACGFDKEIVQLVVCYPEDAHCLTEDPRIRHITFIGSEQVARKVAVSAAKNLIPCTMELGGKDPAIILPSANIEKFESTFMRATFQSMGQGCIATERFLVPHTLLPQFLLNISNRISQLRIGSSLSPPSSSSASDPIDVGSLITTARFEHLNALIASAQKEGAQIICGGKPLPLPEKSGGGGAFYEPTLIVGKAGIEIERKEIFGPVMLVIPYDTVDEAVEIANGSRFGLGASIYGRDRKEAESVARRLECGMVSINDFGVFYLNQSLPFGGCKASGYGRFGGPEGLRALCNIKAVVSDRFFSVIQTSIPPPVDYPVKSAQKSWQFVRGLVRMMYGSSVQEVVIGLVDLIKGSF